MKWNFTNKNILKNVYVVNISENAWCFLAQENKILFRGRLKYPIACSYFQENKNMHLLSWDYCLVKENSYFEVIFWKRQAR